MRWSLVVLAVVLPASVAAAPSVAVAPFEGDKRDTVAKEIAKIANDEGLTVIGPKDTGKAMEKLGLEGELDSGDQRKLRTKLEVDAIIQGKVEGKSVELRISGKGIKTSTTTIKMKSVKSPEFKGDVRAVLDKKLAVREEEPSKVDESPPEEEPVKKKKKQKKKRDEEGEGEGDDGEPPPRHVITQAAITANAGAGFARRGLTYDASGNQAPPPVGTAGASAHVEVEAYPAAMSTLKGIAAGFGLYGDFDKTFLVKIDVPGTNKSAPISQQDFSIGARYRVVFGQHSVAFGVGYAARKYVADRPTGTMLDMPDVEYSAVAPNVVGRFAITPTIAAFGVGTFLLMLDAGPIARTANFGPGKIIAFEVAGGADIALAQRYGLRFALEVSQIGISFDTPKRGVSAATDRTIGLTATFEVLY